jgi:hypothetical protein
MYFWCHFWSTKIGMKIVKKDKRNMHKNNPERSKNENSHKRRGKVPKREKQFFAKTITEQICKYTKTFVLHENVCGLWLVGKTIVTFLPLVHCTLHRRVSFPTPKI